MATDKYAVANGNWSATTTWSLTRGGASGAATPGASDNVIIPSPYTLTLDASGKNCLNLTIESGGYFVSSTINPTSSQQYVRINGTSVVNNGVIGYTSAAPGTNTALCFEIYGSTVTFSGSGISKISRIRNGSGISNTTAVIDQDMTLTYTGTSGTGGVAWYGFNGTSSGSTLKINTGRTVTCIDQAYIGTNSSTASDGPNTTIQVDGSLLMQGANCTMSLRPLTGATVSLIVNGIVDIGRTLMPSGTTGVTSTITVNSGGELKVGTYGPGVAYFDVPTQTVTGLGTFTLSGAGGVTMQIGSTYGLDPINGPIQTTTRNFSTSANYSYVGTSAQVTNLPSAVGSLTFSNSVGITVNNPVTVSGTLTLGGNNSYTNLSNVSGYTGIIYSASVPQTTGTEFGGSLATLTINNSSGVTLGAANSISGALTLTLGNISLGSNNLTVGSVSGGSATSYVAANGTGALLQSVGSSATFPIGDIAYRPVTLASVTGTSPVISARVTNANAGGINDGSLGSISPTRYWAIGLVSGSFTAGTVNLTYGADDGVTDNANLNIGTSATLAGTYTSLGGIGSANTSGNITSNSIGSLGTPGYFLLANAIGGINPLPVELSSLTSTIKGRNVQLNWETKTEVAFNKFDIDRASVNANDASVTWASVGSVHASGTSNTPGKYSFIEKDLQTGKYQYRLKMIDNDGSYKFSDIVETEISIPVNFDLSQNFPNPFNPSTKINYTLPYDSKVILEVFNINGEKVVQLVNKEQSAGYYSVDFSSSSINHSISSGVYFYRITAANKITANNFSSIKKMVLLK